MLGGAFALPAQAQPQSRQPQDVWLPDRLEALVRVSVSPNERPPNFGSGFIVRGQQEHFLVTSTHVLYGRDAPPDASPTCQPLPGKVRLERGDQHVEEVPHAECAWNVGADISLIPLAARANGYPSLRFAAQQLGRFDMVYAGGFPLNQGLDVTGYGMVSSEDDRQLMVARIATFEGMSGGPYLSASGTVVGIHRGGILFRPGIAYFVSVSRARDNLQPRTGPIPDQSEARIDQVQLAALNRERASVGQIAALQNAVANERLGLWQSYVGRTASNEERQAIGFLPASEVSTSARTYLRTVSRLRNTYMAAEGINFSSANANVSCEEGNVSIAEGVISCAGQSRFQQRPDEGSAMTPDTIMIRRTGTARLQSTLTFLLDQSRRASSHVLIDRDGTFIQLVRLDRAAAALTPAQPARAINFELVNLGRLTRGDDGRYRTSSGTEVPETEVQNVEERGAATYWHRFTGAQLATARLLARRIGSQYRIQAVTGQCAPLDGALTDPGPAFPLPQFGEETIGRASYGCPAS